MQKEIHAESSDASEYLSHSRDSLNILMRFVSSCHEVNVGPCFSLVEVLKHLPEDRPSRLRLPPGVVRMDGVMKNKAMCSVFGASDVLDADDATEVRLNSDIEHADEKHRGRSGMTVFEHPLKIDSCAPFLFHGVWFAGPLEVTGCGPFFFFKCCFGFPVQGCPAGRLSRPPLTATVVDLAVDGVCTFTDCNIDCTGGMTVVEEEEGVTGEHEVSGITARGHTRLNVVNSSFSGRGAMSSALQLLDSTKLEADYITVVCSGGHGLIVRGNSSAVVLCSVFDGNKGGVWVRDNGGLEIRDSSIKSVCTRRSALILTERGRCAAHECTMLAQAAGGPPSCEKFVVVARDQSHLLLDACDLSWVHGDDSDSGSEGDGTIGRRQDLPLNVVSSSPSAVSASRSSADHVEGLMLCLVVMREQSVATLTRCVLRLPLSPELGRRYSAIGIRLCGELGVHSVPLYSVQNTVVYGCHMKEGDTGRRQARSLRRVDTPCCFCGLVLPSDPDQSMRKELQQVAVIWEETNLFLRSSDDPSGTISFLTCAPYDACCSVAGILPRVSDMTDRGLINPPDVSPSEAKGEHCCFATPSVPSDKGVVHSLSDGMPGYALQEAKRKMCSVRFPSDGCAAKPTLDKRSIVGSSVTSLTSYGSEGQEEEEEEEELLLVEENNEGKGELGRRSAKCHDRARTGVEFVSNIIPPSGTYLCSNGTVIATRRSSLAVTTTYTANTTGCTNEKLHDTTEASTALQPHVGWVMTSKARPSTATATSHCHAHQAQSLVTESLTLNKGVRCPTRKEKGEPPSHPAGTPHNKRHVQLLGVQEETVTPHAKVTTLQASALNTACAFQSSHRHRRCLRSTSTTATPTSSCATTKASRRSKTDGSSVRSSSRRISKKTVCSDTRFTTGMSPYLPGNAARQWSSAPHVKRPSHLGRSEDVSGTTDSWPWDARALREFLRRKLELYTNFRNYERAFYRTGMGEGESAWKSAKKRHLKRSVLPRRVSLEPFLVDILERYDKPSHLLEILRTSPGDKPMEEVDSPLSSSQPVRVGCTTDHPYNEFLKGCHKTQVLGELLKTLRCNQRQGERPVRGEMKGWGNRMHTTGCGARNDSTDMWVAGSARNYAQQRRQQRLRPTNNEGIIQNEEEGKCGSPSALPRRVHQRGDKTSLGVSEG